MFEPKMKARARCGESWWRGGAVGCRRRRWPGSVREEIMINVLSKTTTGECQRCIRSPPQPPVLWSASSREHTPATGSCRSVQTHARALVLAALPVPFLCGALPAAHAALAKCDLAARWKRKHLTFCPLVLRCLHRIPSFPEYGLSTACTPHGS